MGLFETKTSSAYFLPTLILALPSVASEQRPGEEPSSPAQESVELEFEDLDSPASPNSSLPNLVRGADGEVYLSWVEHGDEGLTVLRFATFEDGAWGEAKEIIRGTNFFANWADFPSLCALKSGALMAHWLRRDGSKHGYNAEFATSIDGGSTWSELQTVHSDIRSAEHGFVSIAPLDDETFAAIWLDGREMVDAPEEEREMNLYFRTISATGQLGDEQVIDSRVCDCCQTSLISTTAGRLLVAYRDRDSEEVRDISFASFDGSSWSEPASVHDDRWLIPGCPVNGPALAFTNGKQSALWFTGAVSSGGRVFLASRTAEDGSFGFPMQVDDGSPVGRVDLIPCEGYLLASWMEHVEASFAEWRVLPIGPEGPAGESLAIARISAGRETGFLRMAPLEQGCVVAWTSVEGERQVMTARLRRLLR